MVLTRRGSRQRPFCSVVVPVHNSRADLAELLDRVEAAMAPWRLELILVDDGSRDGSWEAMLEQRRVRERLAIFKLARNFGQHNAVLCGLAHARGDWVLTLDDDLQHPPEALALLLAHAIERELDVVYGDYGASLRRGPRAWATRLMRLCLRAAIPRLHPGFGSLRVIRGACARQVASLPTPFPFVDGSLTWVTDRIGSLAVQGAHRSRGASGYSTMRLLGYTFNIITTFSSLPLRLLALLGLLVFASGCGYAAVIIVRQWVYDDLTPGYASIMAAILVLGGLGIAGLGLVGEYLGRVNHKTSGHPVFVVREQRRPGGWS